MRPVLIAAVLCLFAAPAFSHSWYSEKRDPVTKKGCCGIADCDKIVISEENYMPVDGGFRIRLTAERAKEINPGRLEPLDIFIPDNRVQPSEDGNFHLCIPRYNGATYGDFYCFFAPSFW